MRKNINLCIDLKTVMQNTVLLEKGQCYTGILTCENETLYRFEETLHKPRAARNPKLFDGNFVSMTRMMNGKYKIHLKTMEKNIDHDKFAFNVYSEIIDALKILD